ncbi:MAG: hypothetical protein AAFU79_03910 [Myxococcota bacterium]
MKDTCLEVAVFDAAPELTDRLHLELHRALRGAEGYVASLPLRASGPERSPLRADLVLWASARAAQAAAEVIPKRRDLASFFGAIAEIRVFHHYRGATPEHLAALETSPFFELAGYPRGPVEAQEVRAQVHRALEGRPEVRARVAAFAEGEETERTPGALDILGWVSPEAMREGPKMVLNAYPELASFFEGAPEMSVFALFEKVHAA